MNLSRSLVLGVLMVCLSLTGWGQTVVTLGGEASVTCPATSTATWTTPPTGVSFSNLTRGSSVSCSSANNGLSGSGFTSSSAANANSGNLFYTVTLTADATHTFTLSSFTWLTAVSSGSPVFTVQYKNNGGALTNFGTTAQTSQTTNTFSGSISVAAGTSLILYLTPYNSSASGGTVRVLNGSTFTVTAASACTPPSAPTLSVTQPTCAVQSGTITVTAPTGAYTYNVDGGTFQAGTGFSGLAPGSHTVIVKDNSTSCTSTGTAATVNALPAIPATPTLSTTQPTCAVQSGTITVTAPTGLYTYNVDGGSFVATTGFSGLAPGLHTILVKDNTSTCTASNTATVNALPAIPATPSLSLTQPTCTVPTGTITVTAPIGAYTYNIDGGTLQTGVSFSGLAAGSHTILVKDNTSSCTASNSGTLIASSGGPANPTLSVTQPTCSVQSGTITVTAPTGAYTYNIDGGTFQTGTSFSGLAPGSHTVIVKDNSTSCTSANSATVNALPSVPANPTLSVTQPTCTVQSGTITVTAPTGAYTYNVDGGSYVATTSFSGLAPGSHTVSVKDNTSTCTTTNSATVNALPSIPTTPANPTAAANPSCGATTLNTMTPASGTTNYWQGTSGTQSTAQTTATTYAVSASGSYHVQAKDNTSGCWSALSGGATVTVNTAPSISAQPANSTITSGNNTTFSVTAANAASYQWQVNTGSGFSNITNGGVYSGATTSTLTITSATTGMSGYAYLVIVGGNSPCANQNSSSATLTVNAGPCTSEGFDNGTSASTGWTIGSGIGTYTSAGNYGVSSPSIKFQATGDQVTTSALSGSNATSLSFWIKGQGTDAFSSLKVEGYNGSTWTTIQTISNLPTTATTITYNSSSSPALPASLNQFRFTYTKSVGNLAFDDVSVYCSAACSSPNVIVWGTQPTGVTQDATMSGFTVNAVCSSTGNVATSLNTGSVTITTSGCGMTGTVTRPFVNGVATFNNIVFSRSAQSGITITATPSATGISGNITSSTFDVTAPAGTPVVTTIINENFDGSSPTWSYSSSLITDNTTYGIPYVGLKDYTTNPYGNSTFKKSLVKSHTVNNSASEGEGTNQILFSNIPGLGSYNSVQVSFLIGSLPSQSSGASGNGVDANENMIVETSLDGGYTWNTVLTYYGSSNYLLPLSTSSPVTLAYNANASYNANHANTSTQSAFVINLPSGTSQFRLRLTATDNREEENWAIDNIQVTGTTIPAGAPKALPSATGSGYSTCANSGTVIGVALTNTQGSISYQWSPGTNISSTSSAGPTVTIPSNTTYTVTVTDGDNCTATASDAITVTAPTGNIILPGTTVSAIEPSCPDATGWTYYTDPSDPTKWLFGIYKNGNNFTANVDITVKAIANTAYDTKQDATQKKATFTMGRYWNAIIATGSINPSNPIKVRFFYNNSDISTMTTNAQAFATAHSPATVHAIEWFKTTTGVTYDPTNNTVSDVPNKLSYSTFTTSQSTLNSIAYTEYDGLTGFSGGTAGIRVSPGGYALPVELIYLTATPVNNSYIRLNWATASEINNKGFEIERSVDGVTFENIGWVDGHGNSNSQIEYTLNDERVVPNMIYYYRLKQVDNDNDYDLSNIVSATIIGEKGFVMESLKPNPAANQVIVNVVTEDAQSVDVSVTDMLGRIVLSQPWQLDAGLNGTQLDISALSQGVYHVTVKSANNYFTKTLAVTR